MTDKPKRKEKNTRRLSWRAIGCSLLVIFLGCIFSLLSYVLLYKPLLDSCEVFISDTNGYRTQVFRSYGGDDFLKYETTRDGGDLWTTFYEVNNSAPMQSDCDAFHVLSQTSFWVVPEEVYYRKFLFVTRDAGETWNEWSSGDVAGLPRGCTIEQLDLDHPNGSMLVECTIYSSGHYEGFQNYNLFSDDGGLTWNLAND